MGMFPASSVHLSGASRRLQRATENRQEARAARFFPTDLNKIAGNSQVSRFALAFSPASNLLPLFWQGPKTTTEILYAKCLRKQVRNSNEKPAMLTVSRGLLSARCKWNVSRNTSSSLQLFTFRRGIPEFPERLLRTSMSNQEDMVHLGGQGDQQ